MMQRMKPYWTAFRIRARLETQYRGAALGGLVTQVFFGLILVYLYVALFQDSNPAFLRETITYVWIQQMFFRLLLASDTELWDQVRTGSVAYTLCRPIDQYSYWLCRTIAMKMVGAAMRAAPMLAVQFFLPVELRIMPPENIVALLQFILGMLLGVLALAEIQNIMYVVNMITLDRTGISAMISMLQMILSGNIIPLTLFPESVQTLMRYQPFAQALDAPTRMYLHAQPLGEWLVNTGAQLAWIAALWALGRWMWNRQQNRMIVQGG